jgi:hypothetical protein
MPDAQWVRGGLHCCFCELLAMLAMQGEHYVTLGWSHVQMTSANTKSLLHAQLSMHVSLLNAPFLHTQTSDLDWRQGLEQQCLGCIALLPAAHRQG